jgi:hypothetical protein
MLAQSGIDPARWTNRHSASRWGVLCAMLCTPDNRHILPRSTGEPARRPKHVLLHQAIHVLTTVYRGPGRMVGDLERGQS